MVCGGGAVVTAVCGGLVVCAVAAVVVCEVAAVVVCVAAAVVSVGAVVVAAGVVVSGGFEVVIGVVIEVSCLDSCSVTVILSELEQPETNNRDKITAITLIFLKNLLFIIIPLLEFYSYWS